MTKYKLVIAEKPSVGMAYAAVLGAKKRMDGYMEGGGWLVSWCFGHLVELAGAETYDERYAKWDRADLPIVPDPWRMKVAHTKKKQFSILKALMEREDVTEIVNGCDAGRAGEADLDALPIGEREVLKLLCRQVLIAVSSEYVCADTIAEITCGGYAFTAKGKTVLDAGWKAYLGKPEDRPLPDLVEGTSLPAPTGEVTEGKTKPPAAYSEDTLLHAMETAGGKDMPEDAERKGIGTPATRAAMIEKLVAGGFVERKKGRKTVSLVPVQAGVSLVTILPEQLQSPLLTAEWEHKLGRIERGELSPEAFLAEITQMVQTLVSEYQPVPGAEVLFPSGREIVGNCPRCGSDVTESKKGFFCEKSDCKFGLWRDNKFLTAKRISLTKLDVTALLRTGRVHIKNIYSEKTGKTFDADLLLDDNGERTVYRFDFGRERTT